MSYQARREYINLMRQRYLKATTKGAKTQILDEVCRVCGYNRSYATRLLRTPGSVKNRKRGPRRTYPDLLIPHIKYLWHQMEQVAAGRMKRMLPLWLKYYDCPASFKRLLKKMSESTLKRFLKRIGTTKGISSTRPNGLLKHQIPIEIMDYKISNPGAMQADTVVHCNGNLSGTYAHTLTMTDIYSGWTENRAIWTKNAKQVKEQIESIEKSLYFRLFWFASDCGHEFLNYSVMQYLTHRTKPIKISRSRPYHKDDNAFVEQKNWTHVRQLFGYDRIDDPELVDKMNEIYRIWNLLHNFFFTSYKLISKERRGARIIKKYDKPKTPAQRLLDSGCLSATQTRRLSKTIYSLNPFELKSDLEAKLKLFFQKLNRINSGRKAA